MSDVYRYLVEPLAPLIFRSGKPFGAMSGADGASFPLPSSASGLLRALTLEQGKEGFKGNNTEKRATITDEYSQQLKQIRSKGPFLVRYEYDERNVIKNFTVFVVKPADALYLKSAASSIDPDIIRLIPKPFEEGVGSDLPKDLIPVQTEIEVKGKPASGIQFWALKDFIDWQNGVQLEYSRVKENGILSLPNEERTHVAIDDNSLSSEDGKLFQTSGLDLQHQQIDGALGWTQQRLGFLFESTQKLTDVLATFGGERRLSHLKEMPNTDWQQLNKNLYQKLSKLKGLRLTLVTPAIFANGYIPKWLDDSLIGVIPNTSLKVQLKAVSIERWLPVSGWDLHQWKPKAMRKSVAAGAVYWFDIVGEISKDIAQQLWFSPIGDDQQDCLDGFGLVLPAAWQNPNQT